GALVGRGVGAGRRRRRRQGGPRVHLHHGTRRDV
ncbi:MAG: hypothetical protein AVDCRST_MAG55-3369, partial [uncultured Rubrobacteraceae bacterium]